MATKPKTIIKHMQAVLKMPKRIGDKLTKAQTIVAKMTGNAYFPAPTPSLATVQAHLQTLVSDESGALSKGIGMVAARDVSLEVVVRDLQGLTLYVQGIADANPDKAAEIIESSGLSVKKSSPRKRSDLTVKNGPNSGTVILVARGAGARSAHNWQISKDQITWIDLPTTIAAKTEVVGLTYGSTEYFRHRAVIATGTEAWTNPVSILVK
jgi:hypothetical protein